MALLQIIFFIFLTLKYFNANDSEPLRENNINHIQVLLATHCPDSLKFLQNVLFPYWEKNQDTSNIELFPYGKASTQYNGNEATNVICQHGKSECKENEHWNCAIDCMKDASNWFPYFNCIAEKSGSNDECRTFVSTSHQECIDSCTSSNLGFQLHVKAGQKTKEITEKLYVPLSWIPYLVLNGKFIDRSKQIEEINKLSV